ncbi:MAG: phosphopentomutase [Kiritimatiellae bacterium]|nr:phosphopentomutase [Kiritimatiellia bacterium]
MKAVVIILDSVGIGAAPDACDYGDEGANTLAHCAEAVGGLRLPELERMGLGNLCRLLPHPVSVSGVAVNPNPAAAFGVMQERSAGKDTTTGHWELAGLLIRDPFARFPPGPPSFPPELIAEFAARTGRDVLGNKAASGTLIIEELGPRQMREGSWIVYTSADSVFQIAAHEQTIPLEELYRACAVARELCDPYRIGRVIARPYRGRPGAFRRTEHRRDFSLPPPERTVLQALADAGVPVLGVGKIEDIYAGRGITEAVHTGNNRDSARVILERLRQREGGLILANLNDFDSLYGHRRDPQGYAACLEQADAVIGQFSRTVQGGDLLIITADHGNDPTFTGTDHTREFVPLLVQAAGMAGRALGLRAGFFDVAQSLAAFFGITPMPLGTSFLDRSRTRRDA